MIYISPGSYYGFAILLSAPWFYTLIGNASFLYTYHVADIHFFYLIHVSTTPFA